MFGLKEKKNENIEMVITDFFNKTLGTKITPLDVDRCYRVGKPKQNNPRSIILKFTSFKNKIEILSKKKQFKGTGVIIKEDLTQDNLNKFMEASNKYGYKNTWSKNGLIFVKTAERVVRYESELEDEPNEYIQDSEEDRGDEN